MSHNCLSPLMLQPMEHLVLASASPRRRELLEAAHVPFEVHPADVDEGSVTVGDPAEWVRLTAALKAACVSRQFPGRLILGSDTVVVLDSVCHGKPDSLEAAAAMLRAFSGRWHQVMTGVCLRRDESEESWTAVASVHFRPLDDATIRRYLSLVPVLDKAGAYAIQEHGELLVDGLEGLKSTVIGLPVEEVVAKISSKGEP